MDRSAGLSPGQSAGGKSRKMSVFAATAQLKAHHPPYSRLAPYALLTSDAAPFRHLHACSQRVAGAQKVLLHPAPLLLQKPLLEADQLRAPGCLSATPGMVVAGPGLL